MSVSQAEHENQLEAFRQEFDKAATLMADYFETSDGKIVYAFLSKRFGVDVFDENSNKMARNVGRSEFMQYINALLERRDRL